MEYAPRARNQKRCSPCATLRDAEYWGARNAPGSMQTANTDGAGTCAVCATGGAPMVAGAPVCRACITSREGRRHQAALEELRTAFDNRKQYAKMAVDPQVPARGSAAYEALTREAWAADVGPDELAAAETALRSMVGDAPLPRYLVMRAALQFAPA